MEDRKVLERQNRFYINDLDDFTVEQVISYFEDIQTEMIRKGESHFKLGSFYEDLQYYFEGKSIETDIEYNERIAAEKVNKIYYESFAKREEEKELAEYKRLKAKYGE